MDKSGWSERRLEHRENKIGDVLDVLLLDVFLDWTLSKEIRPTIVDVATSKGISRRANLAFSSTGQAEGFGAVLVDDGDQKAHR